MIVTQAILHRIASGDHTAVQDCLSKYGGLVWSIARKMLRNSDDAEDAVQEIFVDVWKNAARFDEKQSSETTFIAMIFFQESSVSVNFSNALQNRNQGKGSQTRNLNDRPLG